MPSSFDLSKLAVAGVSVLIAFLAYSSQYLFLFIKPHPLTWDQLVKVNLLAICIFVTYYKICTVDPGRIPARWSSPQLQNEVSTDGSPNRAIKRRWCRRCNIIKPPRAHHCKTCKRCIPKMDHHCPWTANCVSHFTLPHFMRFVFYDVVGISYLEYLLGLRALAIWHDRNEPSYLGPSMLQLSHLFLLILLNTLAWIALCVLFLRSVWLVAQNMTTIESWEIERHETLVDRARAYGGFLYAPDGTKIRIRKQEFPYDIGIFQNIRQTMGGSANVLSWFWPFSNAPARGSGLEFEVNGFEDEETVWPPPDPDRMSKHVFRPEPNCMPIFADMASDPQARIEAFKRRQEEDLRRRQPPKYQPRPSLEGSESGDSSGSEFGEWKNSEGDRLRDFGVDEEADVYDEDDIPLALLQRQREFSTIESTST